jgi:DNA mismatch repair protein MutS
LAGLPAAVIERAKVVLEALEKGEREGGTRQKALVDDLPLFAAMPRQAARTVPVPSPVLAKLDTIHPDDLSPKEALALIYALKALRKE